LADLLRLQNVLGVSFRELSYLEQALVHRSYVNENPGLKLASNERLEFLGDAVLGLIVADELFRDFSGFTEGGMTRLRAALVRRDTLADIAKAVALSDYLYLGKGEEASGGRGKANNLARALEAVIAAVYLDQGLSAARALILKLFDEELDRVISRGVEIDYKTELQELTQARQQLAPVYELVESAGPAHDRRFLVEVKLGQSVLGRGSGKTKKAAETRAAREALRRLTASFTP
jgi:ribonuclease-3